MGRPASMSTSDLAHQQKQALARAAVPPCPEKRNRELPVDQPAAYAEVITLLGVFVSLAGLTRCDIRVAGKRMWRNTLRVSRFRLPLAVPCSGLEPILRCAEISQQRSGSAARACELHGGAPVTLGRGGGWGGRGVRGEVGILWCLSYCRVQHVQLACLGRGELNPWVFKMTDCFHASKFPKCRMSKMPQ